MAWSLALLLSIDIGDGRSVAGLSKAIQLSVAPVFLFTGVTGLLVAAVVAVLFISAVAALDVTAIVVPLFVAAMGAMIVGLLLFLLEVQLAISQNPRRYY
jgi:hypothetical protein